MKISPADRAVLQQRAKQRPESAAVQECSGDVMGEVPEPEGGAAEVFEAAVYGLGGSIAGAGVVEVGQHIHPSSVKCSAQCC